MMHSQRQSGISLILIAVLLVIIGSGVGVMIMRKESAAVWDPKTGSQTDIIAIKDALISFQRTHHRLPCVAQRNVLTGAAGYGEEIANCAGGAAATGGTVRLNIGGGNFLRIGAVPTKTLGMSITAGEDEWKNRILYAVIEKLTDPYQFTAGSGAIIVNDDAGAPKLTDAAFVVLSHGTDGKGAYGAKAASVGKTCASAGGLDQHNCNDVDAIFVATDMEAQAGATYFDDIVVWDGVDKYAQTINRPCTLAITGDANWAPGCTSNAWSNMLDGDSQSANNTNTGTHVGTATLTCSNGALTYSAESCFRHCLAAAQAWQTDCAGNVPLVNHGATSPSVANINPGFTGDATFTCNDGTFALNSSNCAPTAPPPPGDCAAQPVSWGSGNCSGNAPLITNGNNSVVANTNPSYNGTVTATCNAGSLTLSGESCTPVPAGDCNSPCGVIPDGGTCNAYYSENGDSINPCTDFLEVRTCTAGTLSGAAPYGSCTDNPGGGCYSWYHKSTELTFTEITCAAGEYCRNDGFWGSCSPYNFGCEGGFTQSCAACAVDGDPEPTDSSGGLGCCNGDPDDDNICGEPSEPSQAQLDALCPPENTGGGQMRTYRASYKQGNKYWCAYEHEGTDYGNDEWATANYQEMLWDGTNLSWGGDECASDWYKHGGNYTSQNCGYTPGYPVPKRCVPTTLCGAP